jgi:hypothetical protein
LVGEGFGYDSFRRFVEMIDNAGRSIELSAGDFSDLDEEGYRSVVTAAVGQRIDGNLTREAETGRGPSDIRLRDGEGNILYIGECKYWNTNNSGAGANIEKPLNQLETYDQHEAFNSIIVFFKSDDYSRLDIDTVWERAEERLSTHDRSYVLEDEMTSMQRSRIYRSNDGRERFLSVHIIDVGAEQHHEPDAADEEATA